MIQKIILLLFVSVLMACNSNGQVQNKPLNELEKLRTFELPEVPPILQSVEERLNYVIEHYWDKFDFSDTAYIHLPEVTEQAMANYVDLLNRTTQEVASSAIQGMLRRAMVEPKMLEYLNKELRRYTTDPNSPIRNEELYEPAAKFLSKTNGINETMRIKAARDLKLIALNRKGSIANNFSYRLPDGKIQQLHQVSSPKTLLLFFDPDCHTCSEVIEELKASPILNQATLQIVAIYPEGDADIWRNYLSKLPQNWINGHDYTLTVLNHELYNLNAMPTLYLLDTDKRVLVKDGTVREIEYYLQGN
ncbi:MAG: DUF5106 domain-containing protein [Bacteroides sp.]|nr:DUF5106 domain-containing protein [Bacteroides sp.]